MYYFPKYKLLNPNYQLKKLLFIITQLTTEYLETTKQNKLQNNSESTRNYILNY